MLYCNIHTEVQERGVLGLLERDGRFKWKSGKKPLEKIPSKVYSIEFPYNLRLSSDKCLRCEDGATPKAIPIAKFLEVARRPDVTEESKAQPVTYGDILGLTINGVKFRIQDDLSPLLDPCIHSFTMRTWGCKEDAEAHADKHITPKPKDPGPIATVLENKEDWDAMAELLDPLGVRWASGETVRKQEYGEPYPGALYFNSGQKGHLTQSPTRFASATVSHARFVQHVKKYLDYVARKP
jgi:hypothetical protein